MALTGNVHVRVRTYVYLNIKNNRYPVVKQNTHASYIRDLYGALYSLLFT